MCGLICVHRGVMAIGVTIYVDMYEHVCIRYGNVMTLGCGPILPF